jgi:hypothetical protein
MNQRANGEGSIYRRADGRWTAACYVLRPDGTRVRRFAHADGRRGCLVVGEAERKGGQRSPRLTSRSQLAPYLRQIRFAGGHHGPSASAEVPRLWPINRRLL